MQLGQLANLERQRILDEYEEIKKRVAYLEDLLANPRKITYLVRDELAELKKKFGDPRRTEIVTDFAGEITDEDLVANEKVLITISGRGYVKRMPATPTASSGAAAGASSARSCAKRTRCGT